MKQAPRFERSREHGSVTPPVVETAYAEERLRVGFRESVFNLITTGTFDDPDPLPNVEHADWYIKRVLQDQRKEDEQLRQKAIIDGTWKPLNFELGEDYIGDVKRALDFKDELMRQEAIMAGTWQPLDFEHGEKPEENNDDSPSGGTRVPLRLINGQGGVDTETYRVVGEHMSA